MKITIAYTNDTHGLLRGQSFRTCLDWFKEQARPDLLLDGGDALLQGNHRFSLAPELSAMVQAGYDAMAVGNREFHCIPKCMWHKVGEQHPYLLSANLRSKLTKWCPSTIVDVLQEGAHEYNDYDVHQKPPIWPVHSSVLFHRNGARIGVIGAMPYEPWKPVERWAAPLIKPFQIHKFDPLLQCISREAQQLREKTDVVIVLCHCSLDDSMSIAKEITSVDLVFGAHKHSVYPLPIEDTNMKLVQYFVDLYGAKIDGDCNVAASVVTLDINNGVRILDVAIYDIFSRELVVRSSDQTNISKSPYL